MKAVKSKKILLVVAMMLVLSLSVGLTMAYFSDFTAAEGGKKVTLGGKTTIHEEQNDDNKVITIENIGETDVIVRIAVYGPTEITYKDYGDDWADGGDGYWYYKHVLPAGKTTESITAEWDVPADLDDDYNVVVVQESEMAVYDEDGKVVIPDGWADCVN